MTRNVSLGYAIGRLLGLVLVVSVAIAAVPDPIARLFLIVVVVQPVTLLRSISIATARVLS